MAQGFGITDKRAVTSDGILSNWAKHWEPGAPLHITFKKRHLRHVQDELPDLRRFFPEAAFNLSANKQGKPILTITSDTPPVANLEAFRE